MEGKKASATHDEKVAFINAVLTGNLESFKVYLARDISKPQAVSTESPARGGKAEVAEVVEQKQEALKVPEYDTDDIDEEFLARVMSYVRTHPIRFFS